MVGGYAIQELYGLGLQESFDAQGAAMKVLLEGWYDMIRRSRVICRGQRAGSNKDEIVQDAPESPASAASG
jgi:hypothetical protein